MQLEFKLVPWGLALVSLAFGASRSRFHLLRRTAVAATLVAGSALTAVAGATAARAATTFAPGDVVVYRVGTGSGALGSGGTAVFLDEYTPSGTLVQSVPLSNAASGSNKPLVASGWAASEGLLTLSADGRYLVATGYDAALGTSKVGSAAAATTPRTVALVDGQGTVNSSTALTDVADGNNVRSAVSADGSAWRERALQRRRSAPVRQPAVLHRASGGPGGEWGSLHRDGFLVRRLQLPAGHGDHEPSGDYALGRSASRSTAS
jgi:hypothetical protein